VGGLTSARRRLGPFVMAGSHLLGVVDSVGVANLLGTSHLAHSPAVIIHRRGCCCCCIDGARHYR
jgi:hypothetical protein